MKRKKSIGTRILLGIVAVALGLATQVVGELVAKLVGVPGILILFTILGFVVMVYLIYRWAIK